MPRNELPSFIDKDKQTTDRGPATNGLSGNAAHVNLKASCPDFRVSRRALKGFKKNALTFEVKRQGVLVQMTKHFYKQESVFDMRYLSFHSDEEITYKS